MSAVHIPVTDNAELFCLVQWLVNSHKETLMHGITCRRRSSNSSNSVLIHLRANPTARYRTTERCLSVIHSSSTVAILTTETSL
jgi:hypothetical protein